MPRMHRGGNQITRVHRGSTLITRMHRGSELVYSPGEFMFAYSTGTSDLNRTYTMCIMDPNQPGGARSLYDFQLSETWALRSGYRYQGHVYFSSTHHVRQLYRVAKNPVGTGTITPDLYADNIPNSGNASVQAIGVWFENDNLVISGRGGTGGRVVSSPITSSPPVWTLRSTNTTRSIRQTTGSDTYMWNLGTVNVISRFVAFSGTDNTDVTYSTTIIDHSSVAEATGFVYWDSSLWYMDTTGTMYRIDGADGDISGYTTTNVGRVAVDGTTDPGDYYKLFGGL